jgi:hypothetical protein
MSLIALEIKGKSYILARLDFKTKECHDDTMNLTETGMELFEENQAARESILNNKQLFNCKLKFNNEDVLVSRKTKQDLQP